MKNNLTKYKVKYSTEMDVFAENVEDALRFADKRKALLDPEDFEYEIIGEEEYTSEWGNTEINDYTDKIVGLFSELDEGEIETNIIGLTFEINNRIGIIVESKDEVDEKAIAIFWIESPEYRTLDMSTIETAYFSTISVIGSLKSYNDYKAYLAEYGQEVILNEL